MRQRRAAVAAPIHETNGKIPAVYTKGSNDSVPPPISKNQHPHLYIYIHPFSSPCVYRISSSYVYTLIINGMEIQLRMTLCVCSAPWLVLLYRVTLWNVPTRFLVYGYSSRTNAQQAEYREKVYQYIISVGKGEMTFKLFVPLLAQKRFPIILRVYSAVYNCSNAILFISALPHSNFSFSCCFGKPRSQSPPSLFRVYTYFKPIV